MDNSVVMNNGRIEYTITWFIENYSYYWHLPGESLVSPEFIADSLDGTAWTLELFPRGITFTNKSLISLYIKRRDVDQKLENLHLEFEMAVLAADGKAALHSIKCELRWDTSFVNGVQDFLRIDDLRPKSNYLHEDTLIVRCRMWSDKQNIMKTGHCVARTRIGTEKISFLHKVKNFSHLKTNEKKTLQVKSPSKTECYIFSSLYYTHFGGIEGMVIVEIEPSDKNYILRKQKVCLLDRFRNVVGCREIDDLFPDEILDIRQLPLPLTRQTILNKNSEYLPNDELFLILECTFSTGVELEKIEEIQYALSGEVNIPAIEDGCNAAEKLSICRGVLVDQENSFKVLIVKDIELKTKTKSFFAHKHVLCAKSSVFDAMLANDMKVKNTGCIHVDDLENDTVYQLLLFLYTDKLENLQWESAIKLYYAGDKYAVEKLKVLCSSYLIDNISASKASELLLLANTHNDSDLKERVEEFILKHVNEVFGSYEWEELMHINPTLTLKTMCLKSKRKKEGKHRTRI